MFRNADEYFKEEICLGWFGSDVAHIVFIHITTVVKPVHFFMARNRVCKSCLIT